MGPYSMAFLFLAFHLSKINQSDPEALESLFKESAPNLAISKGGVPSSALKPASL